MSWRLAEGYGLTCGSGQERLGYVEGADINGKKLGSDMADNKLGETHSSLGACVDYMQDTEANLLFTFKSGEVTVHYETIAVSEDAFQHRQRDDMGKFQLVDEEDLEMEDYKLSNVVVTIGGEMGPNLSNDLLGGMVSSAKGNCKLISKQKQWKRRARENGTSKDSQGISTETLQKKEETIPGEICS